MASRDTGTEDLLADLDGGVLTLTLNRPQARNAMSDEMNQALARQLGQAALDNDVRCVVLTGAGQGFCAGGDVKGMNERNAAGGGGLSVGLAGDYGGTYLLTQLVGSAKARELYYLSERVSAEDALRLGLANWVVEPD